MVSDTSFRRSVERLHVRLRVAGKNGVRGKWCQTPFFRTPFRNYTCGVRGGGSYRLLRAVGKGDPGEPLQRLVVLLARPLDHDCGQMRPRRRLVPVERLEILPHVLPVEALRGRPRAVAVRRPEPRR